jgi:hypothetical protein
MTEFLYSFESYHILIHFHIEDYYSLCSTVDRYRLQANKDRVNTLHWNNDLYFHSFGRLQGLVLNETQNKVYIFLPTQQFALPDTDIFSVRLLLSSILWILKPK